MINFFIELKLFWPKAFFDLSGLLLCCKSVGGDHPESAQSSNRLLSHVVIGETFYKYF